MDKVALVVYEPFEGSGMHPDLEAFYGAIMKTEQEKRLVQHNFKTTEAEDALIRQKMKAAGIENQSAFLRAMVLKGYLLKLDLPEIRELLRLMKNLTNNVNQMARRLNEHGSVYETEMDDILRRMDELWDIMNLILTRLEQKQVEGG